MNHNVCIYSPANKMILSIDTENGDNLDTYKKIDYLRNMLVSVSAFLRLWVCVYIYVIYA